MRCCTSVYDNVNELASILLALLPQLQPLKNVLSRLKERDIELIALDSSAFLRERQRDAARVSRRGIRWMMKMIERVLVCDKALFKSLNTLYLNSQLLFCFFSFDSA